MVVSKAIGHPSIEKWGLIRGFHQLEWIWEKPDLFL